MEFIGFFVTNSLPIILSHMQWHQAELSLPALSEHYSQYRGCAHCASLMQPHKQELLLLCICHMQKCWKKEFGEESHLRCFSPIRGRRSYLIVLLFSLREWLRESSSWWHLGKRQKHFILWIWDRFWKLCFDSGCEKTRGNPGKKPPVSCGIAWSFFIAQTTLWKETAPRDKCILWSSGSSDSLGITCLDTQPHSL